jgi:flagellar motor switch protein FliM
MESKQPRQGSGNVKFVEPYDFKHPKLFSKEIMRTLQLIHDTLARNMSRIISSSLRYKVDVNLNRIDQLSSPEFVKSLHSPSVIYMLSVDDLGGEIILVLPPELCIHMIERQSGGAGRDLAAPRSLTVIEEKIISRTLKSINQEIVNSWEPYMEFQISSTMYESKPENIHLISVDPTIILQFRVTLGDAKLELSVAYSYSLLKKAMNDTIMKKGMESRRDRLSDEELNSYKKTLEKANVRVQALLGTTSLTLNQIIGLKEGDTIPLQQKSDSPLQVKVNGVEKISAYPGVLHGRKAVKVFELLEEINEQELV